MGRDSCLLEKQVSVVVVLVPGSSVNVLENVDNRNILQNNHLFTKNYGGNFLNKVNWTLVFRTTPKV